jgi:hypothetical protein
MVGSGAGGCARNSRVRTEGQPRCNVAQSSLSIARAEIRSPDSRDATGADLAFGFHRGVAGLCVPLAPRPAGKTHPGGGRRPPVAQRQGQYVIQPARRAYHLASATRASLSAQPEPPPAAPPCPRCAVLGSAAGLIRSVRVVIASCTSIHPGWNCGGFHQPADHACNEAGSCQVVRAWIVREARIAPF